MKMSGNQNAKNHFGDRLVLFLTCIELTDIIIETMTKKGSWGKERRGDREEKGKRHFNKRKEKRTLIVSNAQVFKASPT